MTQSGQSSPDPDLVQAFLDGRDGLSGAALRLEERLQKYPHERPQATELRRMWDAIGELPAPQLRSEDESRTRWLLAPARWAAPLALAAGLAAILAFGPVQTLLRPGTGPVLESRYTADGTSRRVILPDGSVTTLAAGSALHFRFDAKERVVVLERGEALFKVAHDKRHPFFVRTPQGQTRAVGTAFDVRREVKATLVTVTEGIVQVTASEGKEPHRLVAGQQVRYVQGHVGQAITIDTDAETSWTGGTLQFEDAPLHDVIATVERHCSCLITVHDTRLAKMPVNAILKTGDTSGLLNIVRAQAGLDDRSLREAIEVRPSN